MQTTQATEDDLDAIVRRLYEVVSFSDGGEPDWAGMRDLFADDARLVRVTREGIDFWDLEAFAGGLREAVEHGVYTSLSEREVRRETRRLGRVAHVLSTYETRRDPAAATFLARGTNSIQLVREERGWRVVSLCWDEASGEPGFDGDAHGRR